MRNQKGIRYVSIIVAVILLIASIVTDHANAAIPGTMTYQGYIENKGTGVPVNGIVSIKFSLYTVPSGGTALWWETLSVEVNKGVFNVILGKSWSLSTLSFDGPYYLGIKVGADAEMTPRTELSSVGYAFRSDTAELALDLNCTQCISQDELDFPISGSTVNAGNGLTKDGDTIHVGAGTGISVQPDTVSVATGGITNSMLANDSVTTAKILNGQVGTDDLADNAVTTGKILDGQVGSADIANGAVTTAKISIAGAGAGQVLKYNGSSVVWDADQAGGFTLPYSGSTSTTTSAFYITQNGTGWGINGESAGPIGIRGVSNAISGAGIAGYGQSSGSVGVFGQGQSKGVQGYVIQAGAYGIYGDSTGSNGVGVYGGGTGWGGYFTSTGGIGVYGTGPTWGGYFSGNLFASGNVGIGTTSPSRKVHIFGSGPRILLESSDGFSTEVNFKGTTGNDWALYRHGTTADLRFYQAGDKVTIQNSTGNVGIGTSNPAKKLTVRGNILVESASNGASLIELGEGLDYAEGFHVSDKARVSPGNILVIDPNNPGNLMLSNAPYDTKVAGIVAGANGLGSAVRLGVGQFDYDVALAGRVYCNVDTTYGEVNPGDLLTTSPTQGYAMVVKDRDKAQGAILGKAMEKLAGGQKGQILVLVTLQ